MPTGFIRYAVKVGINFALDRGVGRQVVEIDDPIAVPIHNLALEAAIDEAIRLWSNNRVMQGRENRIAREEELAAAILNSLQVDVRPSTEQAAHVFNRAPTLNVDVWVQEPLSFASKRHSHVLYNTFGRIVGLTR